MLANRISATAVQKKMKKIDLATALCMTFSRRNG